MPTGSAMLRGKISSFSYTEHFSHEKLPNANPFKDKQRTWGGGGIKQLPTSPLLCLSIIFSPNIIVPRDWKQEEKRCSFFIWIILLQ